MKKVVSFFTTLLFAMNANATLISLDFDKDQYEIGDVVSADIVISDIETEFGFQKLLGGFSMDLNYDDSLVSFDQANFGDKLNGGDVFESMTTATNNVGSVFLEEISFSFDLFSFQNGMPSFTLATIQFTAIANGQGTPSLENIVLTNDFGDAFTNISSSSELLTVGVTQTIPEPHMFALLLPFAMLLARKRK